MDLKRLIRHLLYPDWRTRRTFPARSRRAIEDAVAASEVRHAGELRFVIEGALDIGQLLRGVTARQRAVELFSELRVWDTEANSGVLIYVQLADRQVEILADRGIHRRVGDAPWQAICRAMEAEFRAGRFEAGALAGVRAIGDILTREFPAGGDNPDELANAPELV
jgi:uncharacterized membrane protein